MTVKKHRCTNCKKYFDAESMTIVTAGKFHNHDCLIEYGLKKTDQVIKKAKDRKRKIHAQEKREYRKKDIDIRKEAARSACHKYINLRDKGKPCICCNRPLHSGVNAGHFHESGNNPLIRYDEDNIHSQSIYCNMYKGAHSDRTESCSSAPALNRWGVLFLQVFNLLFVIKFDLSIVVTRSFHRSAF